MIILTLLEQRHIFVLFVRIPLARGFRRSKDASADLTYHALKKSWSGDIGVGWIFPRGGAKVEKFHFTLSKLRKQHILRKM